MNRLGAWSIKLLPYALAIYGAAIYTSISVMKVFGWIVLLLSAVIAFSEKDRAKRKLSGVEKALACFFSIVVVGALVIPATVNERLDSVLAAKFIPIFIGLVFALKTIGNATIARFFPFALFATAVSGLYSVVESRTGYDFIRGKHYLVASSIDGHTFRGTGFFHNAVSFGHALSIAICFAIAILLVRPRSKLYLMAIPVLACGVVGMLSTYTRGAWIALAVAAISMSLLNLKNSLKVLAVIVFVAATCFVISPKIYTARAASVVSKTNSSNSIRLDLWRANLEMFKEHPVLGVGFYRNELLVGEYFSKLKIEQVFRGHAHNAYLQVLASMGIIGLLAFFAYIMVTAQFSITALKASRRSNDRWFEVLCVTLIGAQIEMWIGALTDVTFFDLVVNQIFLLILAATLAWHYNQKSSSNTPGVPAL